VKFSLQDHLTTLLAYGLLGHSTDDIDIDGISTHHSFFAAVLSAVPALLALPNRVDHLHDRRCCPSHSSHDVRSQELEFRREICRTATSPSTINHANFGTTCESAICTASHVAFSGTRLLVVLSSCQCKQPFVRPLLCAPLFSLSSGLGNNNNLARYLRNFASHCSLPPSPTACASSATCLNGHELDFPNYAFYSHFATRLACTSRIRLHDSALRPLLF
jgi:hypothetical protein